MPNLTAHAVWDSDYVGGPPHLYVSVYDEDAPGTIAASAVVAVPYPGHDRESGALLQALRRLHYRPAGPWITGAGAGWTARVVQEVEPHTRKGN